MSAVIKPATDRPNYDAIKEKQQATWASGDYASVGVTLQIVGERLCEAMGIHAGERFLDVAAGNGNVSLAAARRNCQVVSTDYVPELLEAGAIRAKAEGLKMQTQVADVEALPFADGEFDLVGSTFGVMFAPDQVSSAAEMLRVCRSGGRIGMANWTPTGFIGRIFKIIGGFVPPPAGVQSPALWGTRERLEELFGAQAANIEVTPRTFVFRYQSVAEWVSLWREIYGPIHKAFGALEPAKQDELARALHDLADSLNSARDETMLVHGDYLEVVITKA